MSQQRHCRTFTGMSGKSLIHKAFPKLTPCSVCINAYKIYSLSAACHLCPHSLPIIAFDPDTNNGTFRTCALIKKLNDISILAEGYYCTDNSHCITHCHLRRPYTFLSRCLYIQSCAAQHDIFRSAKRVDQWSIPYCQTNSRTIFDWLRRIRLLRLRRHTISSREIYELWNSVKDRVTPPPGTMADTAPASFENGAFWDSTGEGFELFGSRDAESSTATAATNREDSGLVVRDVSLNRLDLIQSTPFAETAAKYLSGLQPVAVNDLPEDCRTCGICREIYNTGDEPEQACLVGRCGHVLGRTCLSTWVMPKGREANDTCPMCRAVLFKDNTSGSTNESGTTIFARSIEHLSEIMRRLGGIIEDPRNENGQRILDLLAQIEDERYALALSDAIASIGASESGQRLLDSQAQFGDDRYDLAYLEAIASTQVSEVWTRVRDDHRDRAGAGIARPSYLFSEYVLTLFRRYFHPSNVGRTVVLRPVVLALSVLMGRLYERLRRDMERMAMRIGWTENGPPISWFVVPATRQLIETTLERLVDIERQCASPLPLRPIPLSSISARLSVRFPDIM